MGLAGDTNTSKLVVRDCIVRNNNAENFPGIAGASVVRCLLYNNTGWNSAEVLKDCKSTNCTVYGNTGGRYEAGMGGGNAVNCIFWGNGGEINSDGGPYPVTYCDIQGGYAGIGNLSSDPLFVNAAGGDFHLQTNSPAVNAGDPSILDADGSRSDMGAFGGVFAGAVTSTNLLQGLVAYYPFNGNANDESGNGSNAAATDVNLTADRLGRSGQAANFNGSSSVLTLPASQLLLAGSSQATISEWVRLDATNSEQTLFGFGIDTYYIAPPGPVGLALSVYPAGQLNVWTCSDSDRNLSTTLFSTNVWYHLVVVYDGQAPSYSNKIKMYFNGIQDHVSQVKPQVIPLTIPQSANGSWLGARSRGLPATYMISYLAGTLDDVRIYNRALSSNEVSQLYAYESLPPSADPPVISAPPTNQTVTVGQSAAFSVTASGSTPLYFQWQSNGVNILGATNPNFVIASTTMSQAGT